jgi:hypothetical protein
MDLRIGAERAPGGISVVMFVANDEACNADGTRAPRPESELWLGPLNHGPTPVLRLTAVEERTPPR